MTPEITIPVVIVNSIYPGVSPTDIESLVTDPLEKKLKAVDDLKLLTSTSAESFSSIVLEFDTDIDIDDAMQKVREKVSDAKSDLPTDMEDSIIAEINLSEIPIMVINISSPVGLVKLKQIAMPFHQLKTLRKEDSAYTAFRKITEQGVEILPVISKDKLSGVLTRRKLMHRLVWELKFGGVKKLGKKFEKVLKKRKK